MTKSKNAVPVFEELSEVAPGPTPATEAMPETPAPNASIEAASHPKRLTGDALVSYAEANKGLGLSAEELAFGAGYAVVSRKTGDLTSNTTAYQKALSVAFGLIPAPAAQGRASGGGRKLAYRVRSNPNSGVLAITGAYLRELGVANGTTFHIIVDKTAGELILQAQAAPSEPDQALPEDDQG